MFIPALTPAQQPAALLRFGKDSGNSLDNKLALLTDGSYLNGTLTTSGSARRYTVTVADAISKDDHQPIKVISFIPIGGNDGKTPSRNVWATLVTKPSGKLISAAIQDVELQPAQRHSLVPLANKILGK
jgi:hypothetical protein